MSIHRILVIILFFLLACVAQDSGSRAVAYDLFMAKVDRIIVDKEVNISEPVRIGIDGTFDNDCSELARIIAERTDSPNNIELSVYGKRRLNAQCKNEEVLYSGSITISGLQEGRYRVRINGDDSLVEYFSVIRENTSDATGGADTGLVCVEEIAPVGMADITMDGFNSARNQKIPSGTPLTLIVKGNIQSECRSFEGFRYSRIGYSLYVDVLAEYCANDCTEKGGEYNEMYVITGLSAGKYLLYVNTSIEIPFEIVD